MEDILTEEALFKPFFKTFFRVEEDLLTGLFDGFFDEVFDVDFFDVDFFLGLEEDFRGGLFTPDAFFRLTAINHSR